MKVALKLKFDDGRVMVFSVHELLNIAQEIMKNEYGNCDSDMAMKSIHEGKSFNPEELNSPEKWLMASEKLEQGTPRSVQEEINKNLAEYRSITWLKLLEDYRKRIDVNFLNNYNQETTAIWEFNKKEIIDAVDDIKERFHITRNFLEYHFNYLEILTEKIDDINCASAKENGIRTGDRGIYAYEIEEQGNVEKYLFIVHSGKSYQSFKFVDNFEIFEGLKSLADGDRNKFNELSILKKENQLKAFLEHQKDQEDNNIKFQLTYRDIKYYLYNINQYLFDHTWPIKPLKENTFSSLFFEKYEDRCIKDAASHCLTNIRCMIGDLLTIEILNEQYNKFIFKDFALNDIDNNQTKLAIYYQALKQMKKKKQDASEKQWTQEELADIFDNIDHQEAKHLWVNIEDAAWELTFYCQKHYLGLYKKYNTLQDSFHEHVFWLARLCDISSLNAQISETICYSLSYLRDITHRGWNSERIESELKSHPDLLEKTNKYRIKKINVSAHNLIKKRSELYQKFNFILFFNELCEKAGLPNQNNFVEKFEICLSLIPKISSHSEIGISEFYTLLRLFCRSGKKITEDIKSQLLDRFQKNKDQIGKLSCDDFCTGVCNDKTNWDNDHKPIRYSEPSVHFFEIGDRVIGINNNEINKPLYVYDYGNTSDTFAKHYKAVKQLEKKHLKILKSLKINEVNHEEYIGKLIGWYENLLNDSLVMHKNFVYCSIEGFKKLITDKAKTFYDELLRIQHLESVAEHYVFQNLIFNLSEAFELENPQKNTEIVTYPQICRRLPNIQANDLAKYMRSILKREKIHVEENFIAVSILTATWFLAETGRNPLTFMVTLMMLDLIEAEAPYNTNPNCKKYYDWLNMVWNKSILHIESSDEREQIYPQQEGWAGKHPMCHSGSFKRDFSKERFPPIEDSLGEVRQKEGTILINWLANLVEKSHKNIKIEIVTLHGKSKESTTLSKKCTFFIYDVNLSHAIQPNEQKSKVIDEIIKPLIAKRLKDFDCHFFLEHGNEQRSWHAQSWFNESNSFFNTDKPWYTRSCFCIEKENSEKHEETGVRKKMG
jgi:hypothetical protein